MGVLLTAMAVLVLLAAQAIVRPVPVAASECCQACEAKELACYTACDQMAHNEGETDSLSACVAACSDYLYDSFTGCWTHCSYCSPPPSPALCYAVSTNHIYGDCIRWIPPGTFCAEWEIIHDVQAWQVANGWCTE